MNDSTKKRDALAGQFHESSAISSTHRNELLDEGLEESFPASDPPAINITRVTSDIPVAKSTAPR